MGFTPTPVALARRQPILRAISDGRRLGVSTANIDRANEVFRAVGATWFPPRRMWVMRQPVTVPHLMQTFERMVPQSFVSFENLPELVDAAQESPQADYFAEVLDLQIIPLAEGGYAVSGAYDACFVESMRLLRGKFHKFAAAWQVQAPVDRILEVLQSVAGVDPVYVFVHERAMKLEELTSKPKAEIPISVAGAAPEFGPGAGGDEEEQGTGFLSLMGGALQKLPVDELVLAQAAADSSLLDHQIHGVRHLLSYSSSLLADDMGLGKTRQAVVASRLAAGEGRILITCPASLRINWEREIHMVYPGDFVGMLGEDRLETLRACKWVIANYERLGGLVRELDLSFEVFTVDEAHYLKEHKAGRTRNAFIMSQRIPRRFLLTGTPILNSEIELHTLLRISGHPLGQMELSAFRKKYAGGQEQRAALADAISGWMLRRSKKVLKGLGLKTHQVRYVTPDGIEAYERILGDMTLQVMPKIVKLRQTLEALKADFLIETVQSLQHEDKVIVFCEYTESISFLKAAFEASGIGCVTLDGSMSDRARQHSVDQFQNNPNTRVFIGTTMAAGVGITLTAANYVIFASLPWTPAMKRQAEDRAYRLGQRRDVFVLIPIIPGTIDEQILALLQNKTEIEEDVVEKQVSLGLARASKPKFSPAMVM
ncbi:DEAD/DEAH box helicase [Uliginosibacterium gangwonense]|uniref:DEAD/DEAH box helicase n=1 Tax=Uliginosibacterium gangwonense TaxID=392736 RepID=UPI000367332F|nr:DEAD/DEAH box helicase [Uliginosibacterium gangwonense]